MIRAAAALGMLLAMGTGAAWAADPPAPPPPGSGAPGGMSAPDAWKPGTTAELVLLDRLRAQPSTVTLAAGQSTRFGSLEVSMARCVTRPPDLPANAAAFLEIKDGGKTVFRGWMLSGTPAVGQLEHPVYDVRMVTCR